MEYRKHLFAGQGAVSLVVLTTALMAVVALQKTVSRASQATEGAFDDIALLERARAQVADLTDATRTYLFERGEEQRASLGELQKALEPTIDQLVVRARALSVPEAWRIERDGDGYVAWLARAAADGVTVELFERARAAQRSALDAELNAFAVAGRKDAAQRLETATELARRAQLGIIFTSTIALVVGLVLAASIIRKLAAQLRRLRQATNQANRTAAARRELLDIAATDLRASANSIGLTVALIEEDRLRETERAHIIRISSAAQRIEHVLENISEAADVASLEGIELRYERCNTHGLIGTCIDMFLTKAKQQGVQIKTDSHDITTVNADRERLVQVLANLIQHSLLRTQTRGTIVLNATPRTEGVRFSVSDSGPMLSSDVQARVFARDRTSTGIALDLCRRIVEAHGGQLGVESHADKTTLWFEIPS